MNRFCFPMDGADGTYPAAFQRRQDIHADRARDGRYDRSVVVTAFDPGGFALLPIVIERKTVAYLDADLHGSLHRLDAIRPAFGRVRDLITQAMRKQGLTIQLQA